MKKYLGMFLIAVLTVIGSVMFLPDESQAVPAFARQTGQACSSCHFQSFPLLNAFGREFKAGGFTMVGGQGLVEGDMLSLPSVLNVAVFLKTRYVKTNGDADPTTGQKTDSNAGRLDFPDEASLFAGGRIGENIGFLAEIGLVSPASLANFKMPFVFPVGSARIEVIPFTSDSLGPQAAFELLNTGAVGSGRAIEHGKQTSAQQFIGTTDNGDVSAAEGIAFVVSHNIGYLNYTAYVPEHSTSPGINAIASYLRAVVFHQAGDWDLGGGVQWWGGTSRLNGVEGRHRAWAIDAQAQGKVGELPLGLYLSYASANKSNPGEVANAYNPGPNDRKAFSISGQLGVIPNRVLLTLGYLAGKTGMATNDSDNAFTVAVAYKVTQNVKLEAEFTKFSGSAYDNSKSADNGQINGGGNGDTKTTLLFSSAF